MILKYQNIKKYQIKFRLKFQIDMLKVGMLLLISIYHDKYTGKIDCPNSPAFILGEWGVGRK